MNIFVLILINILVAQKALAVVPPPAQLQHIFPRTGIVKSQVAFWTSIFSKYPSSVTLVHDAKNPSLLIDIIDFRTLLKTRQKQIPSFSKRSKISNRYLKRYRVAIKRFRRLGKNALKFGAMEKRIFSVYRRNSNDLRRLYQGNISLRTQTGISDEFIRAANRAQDYLPYMEQHFRDQNVPPVITRLAFVESMFNTNARSKVGASGMWQFMKSTAKVFMRVDRYIDERNSPLKASKGAARLLSQNFKQLRSWPLAITAYNHGRGGMMKAIKQLQTKNMDSIIRRYKSKSFGFASRNFYSEFLAAGDVYSQLIRSGVVQRRSSNLKITRVPVGGRISLNTLTKNSTLKMSEIKKFNQCLNKSGMIRYKNRSLPATFDLMVPNSKLASVHSAIKRLQGKPVARNARKSRGYGR